MTLRQSLLKAIYPILMLKGKFFPSARDIQQNPGSVVAPVSFYSLHAVSNTGGRVSFENFRGKKILIVNTASDCGYTAQYNELETLYRSYKDTVLILAFPANDFKEQEKENDTSIAQFCKLNYGIGFPLMQKSQVLRGTAQHPVFQWLSDPAKNGWCKQQPLWNFSKYLINEEGVLTRFYSQRISPLDRQVIAAIH